MSEVGTELWGREYNIKVILIATRYSIENAHWYDNLAFLTS